MNDVERLISEIKEAVSRDSQMIFYSFTGRQILNDIMSEAVARNKQETDNDT